jgi:hypothetical protein
MLDPSQLAGGVEHDADCVEANRRGKGARALFGEPRRGQAPQACALAAAEAGKRTLVGSRRALGAADQARLDLDEHERVLVPDDQVDLSVTGAHVTSDFRIADPAQMSGRELLATSAKRSSRLVGRLRTGVRGVVYRDHLRHATCGLGDGSAMTWRSVPAEYERVCSSQRSNVSPLLLAIYLNDHLAGATAGLELARRAASSNEGSDYGRFLDGLAGEIDDDRESLFELMRTVDVGVDRIKVLGGWAAEKVGRLKLNGRLRGYSPLSRLLELEGLTLGVRGKLCLWRALIELQPADPRLSATQLARLSQRAEAQLDGLEVQRLKAATQAFA